MIKQDGQCCIAILKNGGLAVNSGLELDNPASLLERTVILTEGEDVLMYGLIYLDAAQYYRDSSPPVYPFVEEATHFRQSRNLHLSDSLSVFGCLVRFGAISLLSCSCFFNVPSPSIGRTKTEMAITWSSVRLGSTAKLEPWRNSCRMLPLLRSTSTTPSTSYRSIWHSYIVVDRRGILSLSLAFVKGSALAAVFRRVRSLNRHHSSTPYSSNTCFFPDDLPTSFSIKTPCL
jgi:hypothetical protein